LLPRRPRHSGFANWLNRNSGAIQAVITIVLVIVTALYGVLTRQTVQATRTSQQPYVFIDVTGEAVFT
jgi:hypothetical protein